MTNEEFKNNLKDRSLKDLRSDIAYYISMIDYGGLDGHTRGLMAERLDIMRDERDSRNELTLATTAAKAKEETE